MSENHCVDCCCAKCWKVLGISEYTGKSIPEHITELREALTTLEAKHRALVEGYREAIEDIADWAAYASGYFRDKHGLSECLDKHRALLESSPGRKPFTDVENPSPSRAGAKDADRADNGGSDTERESIKNPEIDREVSIGDTWVRFDPEDETTWPPQDGTRFIAWDKSHQHCLYTMSVDRDGDYVTAYEPWSGRFSHWRPALDRPPEGEG